MRKPRSRCVLALPLPGCAVWKAGLAALVELRVRGADCEGRPAGWGRDRLEVKVPGWKGAGGRGAGGGGVDFDAA